VSGRDCEDPAATEFRRERLQALSRKGPAPTLSAAAPSDALVVDDLPDRIDATMIAAGLRAARVTVFACGDRASAHGTVQLSVTVATTGQVSNVSVNTTFDLAIGACVASAIASATFAATRHGGMFVLPVGF
jgi:hypothetical protein